MVSDNDFYERFHNSFLYHTNKQFGKNYTENMIPVKFNIDQTTSTENGFGIEIRSNTQTFDFEVWMPKKFEQNFKRTLDTDQFTVFNSIGWGKPINEFLEDYPSNTIVFKQLLENIYRYSAGLQPVKNLDELN